MHFRDANIHALDNIIENLCCSVHSYIHKLNADIHVIDFRGVNTWEYYFQVTQEDGTIILARSHWLMAMHVI